jgi:hypothetical protein
MTSFIYATAATAIAKGLIDFDDGAFKLMLVTPNHTPDQEHERFRINVTGEVHDTGDYVQGGKTVGVTVTQDTLNTRVAIDFEGASWTASIKSKGAIIYTDEGDIALDRVVMFVDFGGTAESLGGEFAVQPSQMRMAY